VWLLPKVLRSNFSPNFSPVHMQSIKPYTPSYRLYYTLTKLFNDAKNYSINDLSQQHQRINNQADKQNICRYLWKLDENIKYSSI